MTAELSSLFGEAGDGQSWHTLALPDIASPAISAPSTSSASPNPTLSKGKNGKTRVANLLALTELRKAAWARIYASGLITGDAAISTTRVPTWKQFDSLMIKRHRYIAVDPRDNRTLGWIACFNPLPLSILYQDDSQEAELELGANGRAGGVVELQVMVAEPERGRGVGIFLVQSMLASLGSDRRYSTVQASFFPENEACSRLFERSGFETVGTRENAVRMIDGPRKGEWRDLVTVELKLPPLQPPTPPHSQLHQHQQERSPNPPPVMDSTIDPNALFFKRPRHS